MAREKSLKIRAMCHIIISKVLNLSNTTLKNKIKFLKKQGIKIADLESSASCTNQPEIRLEEARSFQFLIFLLPIV